MLSLTSLPFHPVAFSECRSFMNSSLVSLEQDSLPLPSLIIYFLWRGCPLYAKKKLLTHFFFPEPKFFSLQKMSRELFESAICCLLSCLEETGSHVQYSLGSENKLSLCTELSKHAWGEGSNNISNTFTDNHL